MAPNGHGNAKKSLNVDSPAFTPKSGNAQPVKVGISPKAAAAAAFTPLGSGTVTPATNIHSKELSGEFIPNVFQQTAQQAFSEFVPAQNFLNSPVQLDIQPQVQSQLDAYADPFLAQQSLTGLDTAHGQVNPYAQRTGHTGGAAFYQDAAGFRQPLNYHLYSSIGPRRENLMSYQRSTTDFFIPDDLREDLQRKSDATLQTFANSTLPQKVEHFHSLVALDTNNNKPSSTFGYPSWIYKATSSRDGYTYALRRIEGFRLNSENAIRAAQSWKRIKSASIVQIHDIFTGRWFGDSSLIVVTDFHPCSQTLVEKYLVPGRGSHKHGGHIIPEHELWSHIVQLGGALRAVHELKLAAQTVVASKVLVTSKNRLRLNGCAVFDVLNFEQQKPIHDLQRQDLESLGRLILDLAARSPIAHQNTSKALDLIGRNYTDRLRQVITWLVSPPHKQESSALGEHDSPNYTIDVLLSNIADKVMAAFDSTLHLDDELTSNLARELENGRLARLLAKLNVILERPEIGGNSNIATTAAANSLLLNQPSSAWSETGERYYLKLFRDYVFHQVDQDGRPVIDLGHIITSLNKLDAGIDEKIQLISRDEQSLFITTFKEVKRGFETAWADINKASNPARR